MIFHQMTWQELGNVNWNETAVVVPVGATEQHGPHLPVDTDTLIVTRLAEELERRNAGSMLLTPTVWLGHSPHHLSFGGTLSLYHEPYIAMIVGICKSYISMGARKIWILNGHGGNRVPLSIVLQQLKNENPDRIVASAEYWNIARGEIGAIRESGFGGLGHACEMETSLYLYMKESGVRQDRIQDDGEQAEGSMFRSEMQHGSTASRVINFDEITSSGVFGKPTLASADKGRRFYEAISERLDVFVKEFNAIGKRE
ncbi:creatininase family protein [Cohnella silvisoli]|uniref:Creatininase family protein n=1 Tax=Cohnella silvisoli TaxID=2873699 RepID=A0ABV1L3M3_9BACL|nr:creatininase family protein [Cohnella silvisoli]MCD9026245.1 creatininase family protein [Cohnella silvisoli]